MSRKDKKSENNIISKGLLGDGGLLSEEEKLSNKQKLMKLFLTSELKFKNKKLWKPLSSAKENIIKNFHDGGCDSIDIDKLFWIYFDKDKDKDVFIPDHIKSRLPQYKVFINAMPNDRMLFVHEYFSILKHIRTGIEPFVTQVRPLLQLTKTYTRNELHKDGSDEMYSGFENEEHEEKYHKLAKERFAGLLLVQNDVEHNQQKYDRDRFQQELSVISDTWQENDHKKLIVFAVLGIHYFDKKNLVFDAFTSAQLKMGISFALPGYMPDATSLTLEEFLIIIQQLNFKKYFFAL
ncbi:MAG: hypothetical protein WC606_04285 [Candidatus Absconditabacterales bacterium]